jgi:hypothetical protein
LQIPYGAGATEMGALLGYRGVPEAEGGGKSLGRLMNELLPQMEGLGINLDLGALAKIDVISVDGCKNIPDALDRVTEKAAAANVALDESTVLVMPLDARHQLAWAAKEEADKRGFAFERHLPQGSDPDEGLPPAQEALGDVDEAASTMNDLCQEAQEAAQSALFGESISCMRHAVGIAVAHFGWCHYYTGHMLRYQHQVLRATGNDDNEREGIQFLKRMCHELEAQGPGETNEKLAACLQMLANEAEASDEDLAERLRTLASQVA